MHLIALLMTGPTCHHHGAWRHPESAVDDLLSPGRYEHIARVLEAGRFDGLFLADVLGLYDLYDGKFDTITSELCPQLVGTPEMIADQLTDLFDDRACDGFVLTPTTFRGMFEQFSRAVVPLLQRRGVFRTEYAGRMLRENLRS